MENPEDTEISSPRRKGDAMLRRSMNDEAEKIIAQLGLIPLPNEGGWFRRTWESFDRLKDKRTAVSAIYFLVTPEGFSALHRLSATEVWCFHAGDALEHVILDTFTSEVTVTRLGGDLMAGDVPQLIVGPGSWQGARLAPGGTRGWALVSCVMVPAWEERSFKLGQRADLIRDFPSARSQIEALTR
jgi:predicted cupin superfamily sugar epimerase